MENTVPMQFPSLKQASEIRSLAGFGEWFWRQGNEKAESFEAGRQAFSGPLRMKPVKVIGALFAIARSREDHGINHAEKPVRDGYRRFLQSGVR